MSQWNFAADERFATRPARAEHTAEAVAILDEIFGDRTLAEWKDVLATTKGVWAAVQTPAEMHEDPQTSANGFIREVHDAAGSISLPVPPVLFDEEAGDVARAPEWGEHTDAVLTEAGYSAGEIARYRETGAIG